eukprot:gb/GEZN01003014.1/.p1 GENE.gb/GEZN01003014.1/~~gb/GEZN01003014.1/.p1  ORF type:complete len:738 (-),score=97.71 gb/GEZN01003014.1/:89-2275(-)
MWAVGSRRLSPLLSEYARGNIFRGFAKDNFLHKLRNIGISAHIDSGKTTLTERILFYTGRIHEVHDVRGRDGVGAKMDFMELEREKGITIQSAATHATWGGSNINIIDTPGHVDFTIEVERALRVLDGAVLVLCGVSGVQSQSLTVHRQMKRYNVPRVVFINKLDRMGANPWRAIDGLRKQMGLNACAVQIPIGLEDDHVGCVDLLKNEAVYFEGSGGLLLRRDKVPEELNALVEEKRKELVSKLADVDEGIADIFLMDEMPDASQMKEAIRKATINLSFVPVFMGSAFKNKGVQLLLDGVVDYLPNPTEVKQVAYDASKGEEEVSIVADSAKPFVGYAFKIDDGKFGQLTYMRIYQGTLKKGMYVVNTRDNKKVKVPRVVRMHANEMKDIDFAEAGDIVALFGVDCPSGTSFTDGPRLSMQSMHVPKPVISLSVAPKKAADGQKFAKAMDKFTREDPTFQVGSSETGETLISGMGELHLQIYVERLVREFGLEVKVGPPEVNYREAINQRTEFNYTHRKQTGGQGQFGRLQGYLEPLDPNGEVTFEFQNKMIGNDIPPELVPAIEKGFMACRDKGFLTGQPVAGVRVVITEGSSHPVDSTEFAFKNCALGAFRDAFQRAKPIILEPLMTVQVEIPGEFQSGVVGGLIRKRGQISNVEIQEGNHCVIDAEVPLEAMFGYSTDLRSATEGKGTFSMEFNRLQTVSPDKQNKLIAEYKVKNAAKKDDEFA